MAWLKVGDWVSFTCDHGRILLGKVSRLEGSIIMVKVGRKVYHRKRKHELQKISYRDAPKFDSDELRVMIDIALDAKDRQWFRELTEQLKRLEGETQ
ncbi:IDEAL domain-containing protein [Bacillus spizizenii]|nr:IDEAL domain-containing protein [Bacillus spizizenii]MCY8902935.1 IDEAL domain-containing protein [Bacillus spizizenii]MCY8907040.1 IDEAL domain-containing protein [Bacillus spizizenii]